MKTPGFRCDLCREEATIDCLFGLEIFPAAAQSLGDYDRTFAITDELAAKCSVHICVLCARAIVEGINDYDANPLAEESGHA